MSDQLDTETSASRTEPLPAHTEPLPTRQRETAMLVLQRGSEAGRRWPLDRTRTLTIGRSDECDIVLPDRQVSRHHARINWQDDGLCHRGLGQQERHARQRAGNARADLAPRRRRDSDRVAVQAGVCGCGRDGPADARRQRARAAPGQGDAPGVGQRGADRPAVEPAPVPAAGGAVGCRGQRDQP